LVAVRRLRQMRRMRLARLRRLRRLRRLLLLNWTLPRLLRRNRVPTKLIDINCHGRVLLDPAHFAFLATGVSCDRRFLRPAFLAICLSCSAAGAANNVDKGGHAG
jgi:hypothetical protein